MITNCNVTLYNKYIDKTTLKECYKKTIIKGANWQGEKVAGVSTAETGKGVLNIADAINIYIPFGSDFGNKTYIEPKAWAKLLDSERDNYFTFQSTDRIVKGECDFTTSATTLITGLSSYDNTISIMSIKINDLGSKNMRHYAIGGK